MQVSRLYNALSREPVIWRRLLRRTTLPIPPLCPGFKLETIPGREAEGLLFRAHELGRIWRNPPQQTGRWKFDSTEGYVAEMTMVAGGQFLLASVSNESKEDWKIAIYAIHGRERVCPIAHLPTETKAYDIKAKWLTVQQKRSLVITYIKRKFVSRAHRRRGCVVCCSRFDSTHPGTLRMAGSIFPSTLRTKASLLRFLSNGRSIPNEYHGISSNGWEDSTRSTRLGQRPGKSTSDHLRGGSSPLCRWSDLPTGLAM